MPDIPQNQQQPVVPQQQPVAQPTPVPAQPAVQPAPVVTTPAVPTVAQPVTQPAAQPAPAPQKTPEQLKEEKRVLKEKKKRKTLLIFLLTALGFVFITVFVVAFFILSRSGGSNPLLQLFGVSEEELYPFLINLTSLFFGFFDFLAFVLAIIGAFIIAMAKKEDKPRKKKGAVMLILGVLFFMLISIIWAASYYYLQQKKAQYMTEAGTPTYIVTNPENTTDLTAPALVEFDASNLPVDTNKYTIISYVWDFGDGATATGPTVSHRYTTKGENNGRYTVVLSVTYSDNKTGEEAVEPFTVDVVFTNEKVNAFFTATQEVGEIPLTVQFDASESMDPDGEIVEYEWDLDGDGSYDDGNEVTSEYTYTQYGTYTVKLRVTDNNGETSVAEKNIEAQEAATPTGTIDVTLEKDGVLYVGKDYLFDVTDASSPNGEIKKYEWNFGDGSSSTRNKTAKHTFDTSGTYIVTLTLTDEENETGTVTLEVTVETSAESPIAILTTDQPWSDEEETTITGEVPFTVVFSAKESTDPNDDIVNYEWDLDGDGTTDEVGESVEYVYEEKGTYQPVLYIQDSEGNEGITTIVVVVSAQSISASVTASPVTGEIPLQVTFDASGSRYPEGEIVNYLWDFGNGTTRYDDAQISYTFSEVGTFTVNVTAIASDGNEDMASVIINARPVALGACFESNVNSGVAPLVATFNPSCSTGTVTDYRWDFSDGDISYARKPTHTFEAAGTYTVTLTVTDSDGVSDTYTQTIAVYSE